MSARKTYRQAFCTTGSQTGVFKISSINASDGLVKSIRCLRNVSCASASSGVTTKSAFLDGIVYVHLRRRTLCLSVVIVSICERGRGCGILVTLRQCERDGSCLG